MCDTEGEWTKLFFIVAYVYDIETFIDNLNCHIPFFGNKMAGAERSKPCLRADLDVIYLVRLVHRHL